LKKSRRNFYLRPELIQKSVSHEAYRHFQQFKFPVPEDIKTDEIENCAGAVRFENMPLHCLRMATYAWIVNKKEARQPLSI
jgi:hypothetical protein